MRRGVEIDPFNPWAITNLAIAYHHADQRPALRTLDRVQSSIPVLGGVDDPQLRTCRAGLVRGRRRGAALSVERRLRRPQRLPDHRLAAAGQRAGGGDLPSHGGAGPAPALATDVSRLCWPLSVGMPNQWMRSSTFQVREGFLWRYSAGVCSPCCTTTRGSPARLGAHCRRAAVAVWQRLRSRRGRANRTAETTKGGTRARAGPARQECRMFLALVSSDAGAAVIRPAPGRAP
jgi:hypothetical protein